MRLTLSTLFCLTIFILSISSIIAQPGRQRNDNGTSFQGPSNSQNGAFGNQSTMNQQRNGGPGGFSNQNNNGTRPQGQQGSQNGPMGGSSSSNQSAMNQQQNGGFGGFGSQNNNGTHQQGGQQSQQNQQGGPQGSQSGSFGNQNNNGTRQQSQQGQQGQQGPSAFQDGGFGKQNDTRALPTDQSGFGERQGPGANLTSASSETSFASGFFGHFMVSLVIILLFGFVISVLFYRQELKKNGTAPFAAPSFCPKALYPAAPLAHENMIEIDNHKFQAHPFIEEGEGYDGVL